MTFVDALCLLVAVLALGGWAYTNVATMRALLPQSQALQALFKLNAMEDEKIRAILARFDGRPKSDTLRQQLEQVKKQAQERGFAIDSEPQDSRPQERWSAVGEAPEPLMVDLKGFVDG